MTAATSPSSGTSAVVDASVAIRALVDRDPAAEVWLSAPAWPSLAYVEIAHVLARLCRNHVIGAEHAERILDAVSVLDADVRPVEALVGQALPLALERGLSVYDACYVVLAEGLDLPLVTADRKLADATANAILIG